MTHAANLVEQDNKLGQGHVMILQQIMAGKIVQGGAMRLYSVTHRPVQVRIVFIYTNKTHCRFVSLCVCLSVCLSALISAV